jgi:TP901 family phage tail tape measure protein
MSNEMKIGLVLGGAVSPSLGAAFKDVEGKVKRLDAVKSKPRALQSMIGETRRLQQEWRQAHTAGSAAADGLLSKLENNLAVLRKQGVEVRNLGKAYVEAGRQAQALELKSKGREQLDQGKTRFVQAGMVAAGTVGVAAASTKVSAEYGAIIRDIAIKSGIANKPEEAEMSRTIIDTSRDTGMARNDVAGVVNALVGAGMDLKQALAYVPVASKFVVGQGADGVDTAKMINALGQNAKITDPKEMQKALEAIAYQGQAGSFEASDMAKWFPDLLAQMGNMGITGTDAVTQLGAMLQVQMKTAGSSDEAANNLKNWISKIGSGDVVKAYKDAGIDYQKSMNTGLKNGKSTLETSFALAQKYVETTDPKKAKQMSEAMASISKETDPKKAKEMMASLEGALRTGDLFADMQVKAALTGYMQNKQLYEQLKKDSNDASGILDKNLAERRDTSAQKWAETGQAMNDAMRSIGDALRPVTDVVSTSLTKVAQSITDVSDKTPALAMGLVGAGAAVATVLSVISTFKVGKGLLNLGRGALAGRGKGADDGKDKKGGEDDKDGKPGKAEALKGLLVAGVSAYKGKAIGADDKDGDKGEATKPGEALIDAGLKVFESFAEGKGDGKGEDGDKDPQKVFVVNASEIGGSGVPGAGSSGGASDGPARRRRSRRRRNGPARPPARGPVPPTPPVPHVPPVPAVPRVGAMARLGAVATKVGGLGKAIPGGSIIEAGAKVLDTYQNAETQNDKAEGYGSAAGGLAGTMAGAAAGAAIGSVVPVIGTVVGGAIGAFLGGMGGDSLGAWAGKKWFGDDEPDAETAASGDQPAGAAPSLPALGDVARSFDKSSASGTPLLMMAQAAPVATPAPVQQQSVQISPTISLVVQGDAKDPQGIIDRLMPELERRLRDIGRQAGRSSMYDEAHVQGG